jgi:drug/metabolite transporter (DMT)-like permease
MVFVRMICYVVNAGGAFRLTQEVARDLVSKQGHAWIGYLMVLAATAIWSGNFIVARGLSHSIPPVTLAFLRWATAVLALAPFGLRSIPVDIGVVRRHLGYLCLTAFLGVTVFNTLIYIAAYSSEALNLSLIAICSPAFTVVFARLFLREAFTLRRIVGVLVATAGVVALITGGEPSRLRSLTFSAGDLWMLLAAAIFAVYGILVRKRPADMSQGLFLTATFVLGTLFLLPWAAWELTQVPYIRFTPTAVAAIIYLGIGPSLVAFSCWNRAIAIIGPVRAGFVYYCLPLFSGLEAFLLLHEPVHWMHLWSGVVILAGVVVATRE